jgi:hypothetical protein
VRLLLLATTCAALAFGCRELDTDDATPTDASTEEQAEQPILVYDANVAKDLTTTSRLMAIPASRIGLEEPVVFHETPERFPINDVKYWSSNGEVLILDEGWFELSDATWTNRVLFSRYDRGKLSPPTLIPDLPGEGFYLVEDFDVETNTALLSNRDELYAVRFESDEPISWLVLRSDQYFEASLCRGSSEVVIEDDQGARITATDGANLTTVPIGDAYTLRLSPKGDYVVVTRVDEATGAGSISIGRCTLEPDLTEVAVSDASIGFAFSTDGRRLLASGSSDDKSWLKVLELDTDPTGNVVFESAGRFDEVWWSADGETLAFLPESDGDWWLLRIPEQSVEPLPDVVDRVEGWAGEYLVVVDDEGSLAVIDPKRGTEPERLVEAGPGTVSEVMIAPDAESFACVRRGAADELFVIQPARGVEGVELAYAGTDVPPLLAFPGAKLGVLGASDGDEEPMVWWLPLGENRPREPIVYSPADFAVIQPNP